MSFRHAVVSNRMTNDSIDLSIVVPTLNGGPLFREVLSALEIQEFDGTIEEVENEAWLVSAFVRAAPPEDYSGSLDMEAEDTGLDTEVAGHQEWTDPRDYLDKSE